MVIDAEAKRGGSITDGEAKKALKAKYPYDIWNVSTTFGTGAIHFKQIGEVNNDIMLLN